MAKGRGVDLGGCYLEAKDGSRLPFRRLSSLNSGRSSDLTAVLSTTQRLSKSTSHPIATLLLL